MLDYLRAVDAGPAFELLQRGGPVVAIIAVMSVVAFAVALLKLAQFSWRGIGRHGVIERALGAWFAGDSQRAIGLLENRRSPTAHVVAHAMKGLSTGAHAGTVREDAERLAHYELAGLRSLLRVLEATSQIAPLLGLFGTVLGMMSAFQALQSAGAEADPAALAGGIWVALITTAAGLAVAIPAGLLLYWFEGRIDRETSHMENAVTSLFTARLRQRPAEASFDVAGAGLRSPGEPAHGFNLRGSANAAE